MAGNGMKGMNIEAGEALLKTFDTWIEGVETTISAVDAIITALEASWHGPDSQAAIEALEIIKEGLNQLKSLLEDRKDEFSTDLEEQRSTSEN